MTKALFSSLPLNAAFLANIAALDYAEMTPIQAQALPLIFAGKDIFAQAKTGSGKTAAFAIGLLNKLVITSYRVQALVLCPTRELADQVTKDIRSLARSMPNTNVLTLCGGKPMGPQLASLERTPHVIVGTPGRVLKHIENKNLDLSQLETFVLDEADRMLDMGFCEDIERIIQFTPKNKQTMLFSATYPDEIKAISAQLQRDPAEIIIASTHENTIKQLFFEINKGDRTKAIVALLQQYRPESTLIFCNRKQQCQELAQELWKYGVACLALHGDLEQKRRNEVIVQFANNSCAVLIATDVAARGLDIKDLSCVINFELPSSPEIYVHRIGRTGRAGSNGVALSLYLASEAMRVNTITEYQKTTAQITQLPSFKNIDNYKSSSEMVTLSVSGGRKEKIRPGDILGALTAPKIFPGKQVGKIDSFDTVSFVAVEKSIAKQALKILSEGTIKGKRRRVKKLNLTASE